MIDFGCVNFRILWIKFWFSRVKVCVMVGYGSSEGNGEERERIVDRVGNGYRLSAGNGWIGERVRAGITGALGVPVENDNGRRVVESCAERGLCE